MSPVDRWPAIHGVLWAAAAMELTGAQAHRRYGNPKLATAIENWRGGGGGFHCGLWWPA
jgi:hypothetical protein